LSVYTDPTEIAEEIKARVAQITTGNGYTTNVGATVRDGKIKIDDQDVPCTSVVEGADIVQSGVSQRMATAHIKQQYALVSYLQCDPDAPNTAARQAIRDLKRAIFRTDGKPDPTWGNKVRAVRYMGRNIGPRADGAAIVMAIVEIEVDYAEDLTA